MKTYHQPEILNQTVDKHWGCAAVLPVPAAVMSLAAGAIFKLPLGSLLVWIGAMLGEIGCFIIGRYV